MTPADVQLAASAEHAWKLAKLINGALELFPADHPILEELKAEWLRCLKTEPENLG